MDGLLYITNLLDILLYWGSWEAYIFKQQVSTITVDLIYLLLLLPRRKSTFFSRMSILSLNSIMYTSNKF